MSESKRVNAESVVDNDKEATQPCLEIFTATSDLPGSKRTYQYRCGLRKGHDGGHAWRGDLPGGRVRTAVPDTTEETE